MKVISSGSNKQNAAMVVVPRPAAEVLEITIRQTLGASRRLSSGCDRYASAEALLPSVGAAEPPPRWSPEIKTKKAR
jgi:hypothetical protein